jgi:hypothetical protein
MSSAPANLTEVAPSPASPEVLSSPPYLQMCAPQRLLPPSPLCLWLSSCSVLPCFLLPCSFHRQQR